ncbi:MAG TPA: HXXEE domain-containing protein [Thermoanaerobaculia bacterium]|nr:HXXEE domain-containing protein [Thermoanaerobaculia bacterium]
MNVDDGIPFVVSTVLIALAAVHIAEEAAKGFRSFFNMEWFGGNANCPVGRIKGLFVDQIGLFLLLAVLAVMGARLDARWILIAVGIITADLVQHSIFSIKMRKYTPGVATSALYLLYVIFFFGQEELRSHVYRDWAWAALAVGAAFIAGNYVVASRKARLC